MSRRSPSTGLMGTTTTDSTAPSGTSRPRNTSRTTTLEQPASQPRKPLTNQRHETRDGSYGAEGGGGDIPDASAALNGTFRTQDGSAVEIVSDDFNPGERVVVGRTRTGDMV